MTHRKPAAEVQLRFTRLSNELASLSPRTSDVEQFHQFRVAIRRLRALLRAAREMFDPDWVAGIQAELSWLGDVTGEVRDLDVMIEALRSELAGFDADNVAAEPLLKELRVARDRAHEVVMVSVDTERYPKLIDTIGNAPGSLWVRNSETSVKKLAGREFRKLRKAARMAGESPSDETLHSLRIRGKRARYAAELAESSVGKSATAFISQAKLPGSTR